MYVTFRQGIVSFDTSISPFSAASAPGGVNITLNVGTQPFIITVANQTENYLWLESETINAAWKNLSPSGTYWLYFDFNPKTFERTFGTSTLRPIVQSTTPSSPSVGQHWYNTAKSQMSYWTGSVWSPVIRLFVAQFVGPSIFNSLSINAPSFVGSTVGDTTANYSGRVLFDENGDPIIKSNGTFFTTEDQVFAQGTAVNSVRLESNVYTVQSSSGSIIPAFYAVAFQSDGTIKPALYKDAGTTAIGVSLQQFDFGGVGAVLLEGTVTNPNWNFAGKVGSLLWISATIPGVLQTTDPYLDSPGTVQIQTVPVARVLDIDTIIFLQGIGTKGEPGPAGTANIPLATPSTAGIVTLSTDGGTSTPSSVVVSENDPRLTNARTPLPHTQSATTVTTTPYTSASSNVAFSGPSVQLAMQQMADATVARSGSTMTGLLVLSADPTVSLGAATKHYVDTSISALSTVYLALAGGTMTGPLTLSANPTSALQAATKQYVDSASNLQYTAGSGLSLTGQVFSVATAGVVNSMLANPTVGLTGSTGSGSLALGGTFNILGDATQGVSATLTGGTLTGQDQNIDPTLTISVQSAGTVSTTLGVASFDPADFTVTNGYVQLVSSVNVSAFNTDVIFATSGQTVIPLTNVTATSRFPTGTVSYLQVFVNGVLQREDNSTGNALSINTNTTVNVTVGVSTVSATYTGYATASVTTFGSTAFGSIDNANALTFGTIEAIVVSTNFGTPSEGFTVVITGSSVAPAQNAFYSVQYTLPDGTWTLDTSAATYSTSGTTATWYWPAPDTNNDLWTSGTVQPVVITIATPNQGSFYVSASNQLTFFTGLNANDEVTVYEL